MTITVHERTLGTRPGLGGVCVCLSNARLGPVLCLIDLPLQPANERDEARWKGLVKTWMATNQPSPQHRTMGKQWCSLTGFDWLARPPLIITSLPASLGQFTPGKSVFHCLSSFFFKLLSSKWISHLLNVSGGPAMN